MYLKIDRELLMELWECANKLSTGVATTKEQRAAYLGVACKAATYLTAQPAQDDAKNVSRYRWLRKHNGDMVYKDVRCFVEIPQARWGPKLREVSGDALDAAIDAAMAGGGE